MPGSEPHEDQQGVHEVLGGGSGGQGSWTGFQPPRGVTAPTMGASAIAIAGTPDGCAQIVAVGLDGRIWHALRQPDGTWTPFAQVPGPNGRDPVPAGQVRIAALRDGTTHLTAVSAGWPANRPARQMVCRRAGRAGRKPAC
ncbi:hypothetical protein ACIGQE_17765 [Streptomyces sp. NPDC053429]|uniref:hypothetical protein n=1 Tax=Streptomyces sp. NPDC053429 TaxID=3365702 RepID=UPI0037D10961